MKRKCLPVYTKTLTDLSVVKCAFELTRLMDKGQIEPGANSVNRDASAANKPLLLVTMPEIHLKYTLNKKKDILH